MASLNSGCGTKHEGLEAFQKEGIHLLDNRGEEVNIRSFASHLGDGYSTLSFMYAGCGTTCPGTAFELTELSKKYPNMKHIIISLTPASDIERHTLANGEQDPLTSLEHSVSSYGLEIGKNAFVFYPSSNGKSDYVSLFQSHDHSVAVKDSLTALYNRKIAPVQRRYNIISPDDDYTLHGSGTLLINPQGEVIDDAPLGSIESRFSKDIEAGKQQGRTP